MRAFRDIFRPTRDYPYFKIAEAHPFRHESSEFEAVNAAWLAEASALVYVPDHAFVREQLAGAGLGEVAFFQSRGRSENSIQCFAAHGARFAIVCFKGTYVGRAARAGSYRDLWSNMKLRLTDARPGDGGGGQVHRGYRDALDGIWPALSEHVGGIARACADPPTFWLTGHSLGGALATLAAHRFENQKGGEARGGRRGPVKGLYTFGSPRVGDDRFRDSLGVKAYRCVTENDFVMHLPPKLIASRDYRHVGEFRCVDAEGRITGGQSLWERKKRAAAGPVSRLNRLLRRSGPSEDEDAPAPAGMRGLIRSLEDHAPIRYAERFRRALDRDE